MFQTVNGVRIRELEETKGKPNIIDKRFEIEYLDKVYLHKTVCMDFMNIVVEEQGISQRRNYGRFWIFAVKDTDFSNKRKQYEELGFIIRDKIEDYLIKKYGYKSGVIIMDSMDNVHYREE